MLTLHFPVFGSLGIIFQELGTKVGESLSIAVGGGGSVVHIFSIEFRYELFSQYGIIKSVFVHRPRCSSSQPCSLVVSSGTTKSGDAAEQVFHFSSPPVPGLAAYSVSSQGEEVEVAMECLGGLGSQCAHVSACLPVCGGSVQCVQAKCAC